MGKSIKAPLSEHHQALWEKFLVEERLTSNEGVYHLIQHLYLEESSDIRRFRKKLRERIAQGINKEYFNELLLLHCYLQHLIKTIL